MLARQILSGVTNDITAVRPGRVGAALLLSIVSFSLLLLGARGLPPAVAERALSADKVLAHQEEPEEVTLTLRSDGFDPAEVMRPAGRFMLSVDNRSGVDAVTLILRRGNGSKVVEIKVLNGHGDWGESIELQPGRYTLIEADHPSWKCDFLINEKK
jgi:hypothetical protein